MCLLRSYSLFQCANREEHIGHMGTQMTHRNQLTYVPLCGSNYEYNYKNHTGLFCHSKRDFRKILAAQLL